MKVYYHFSSPYAEKYLHDGNKAPPTEKYLHAGIKASLEDVLRFSGRISTRRAGNKTYPLPTQKNILNTWCVNKHVSKLQTQIEGLNFLGKKKKEEKIKIKSNVGNHFDVFIV